MNVGIVGCGAIGSILARECTLPGENLHLAVLHDRDESKAQALARELGTVAPVALDLTQVFTSSDLVIEAASASVVGHILSLAQTHDTDVLIMSAGGVLGNEATIETIQRQGHPCVYLPSGALAGLDALAAASLRQISSVTLTTTKPPQALIGAPYLQAQGIDVRSLEKATLIFEGPARQAIEKFPENINVSATLSLAGIGLDRTLVRIIADPQTSTNTHHVRVEGAFGQMETTVHNVPSGVNPKTSYLASLSALAVLRRIVDPIRRGT